MKVLYNSSNVDVIKFAIEEIDVDDATGKLVLNKEGGPRRTGMVYEWSLRSGEKAEFPTYVADQLMKVYGFIEELRSENIPENVSAPTKEVSKEVEKPKADTAGGIVCPYCGQSFKTKVNYGMHLGSKHAEKI